MNRRLLGIALVLGLGLMAAPAVFQMFTRAPKGGHMMTAFKPYMTKANVAKFQGYMAEIEAADADLRSRLPGVLQSHARMGPDQAAQRFASLAAFEQQWPQIKADMSDDMLTKIDRMVPNYQAVNDLPPFPLFPWFFVLPGLFVAVAAGVALRRDRRGRPATGWVRGVAVLGAAIVLAPAVFQMFTRAPKGKEMIDVFQPIMTAKRVSTVQGYFLTIGAAEGEVRTQVRPALAASGYGDAQWAAELPAADRFARDWPRISTDFAPMIGAMSDNLGNYAAVKALPPFSLFPWFFVVPGLLICGLALAGGGLGTRTVETIERVSAEPALLERRGS